tara:strand:- start:3696 stop:5123 length:1428 start_codon:yes stop_codon:yes gene_type:complete
MNSDSLFLNLYKLTLDKWKINNNSESIFSLALEIDTSSVLDSLEVFSLQNDFLFLWDKNKELSFSSAGKCQYLICQSDEKFNLARRFTDRIFSNLIDCSFNSPEFSLPKIIYSCSFGDDSAEIALINNAVPSLQAFLPTWIFLTNGNSSWLRMNVKISNEYLLRKSVEEICIMHNKLNGFKKDNTYKNIQFINNHKFPSDLFSQNRLSIEKGIDLVNKGLLIKLVLAIRYSFNINGKFNIFGFLKHLQSSHPNSFRFLLQTNKFDSFLGASPERLFSIRKKNLLVDALAGTAHHSQDVPKKIRTKKNLREHKLVVSAIVDVLKKFKVNFTYPEAPIVANFGDLFHLYTPIRVKNNELSPFDLLATLHPTPAVAGYPRDSSLKWISALEDFDRGNYSGPIGWIDIKGDSDFIVALRSLRVINNQFEFTAGAGLVKGSESKDELDEIKLKLLSLINQIEPFIHEEDKSSLERRDSII